MFKGPSSRASDVEIIDPSQDQSEDNSNGAQERCQAMHDSEAMSEDSKANDQSDSSSESERDGEEAKVYGNQRLAKRLY